MNILNLLYDISFCEILINRKIIILILIKCITECVIYQTFEFYVIQLLSNIY